MAEKKKTLHEQVQKLALSAMFLAIGMVLPFLTGQIPQIGSMLLPMHIPVLLCGLICGWQYGLAVGAILPLLRSVTLGMPPLFPTATAMTFELATYGAVVGVLYGMSRHKCTLALYRSMIASMLAGRVVWGVVMMALTLVNPTGNAFTWQVFFAGAFLEAIPGIVLQLVLIPALMLALKRTRLVPMAFDKAKAKTADK